MTDFSAIKARWVITDAFSEPIPHATIIIHAGIIVEITNKNVPQAIDLNNSIIIPALINAHTHLEFSSCLAPLKTKLPFTSWIKDLLTVRQESSALSDALKSGLLESTSNGVFGLGEIATWLPIEISHFKQTSLNSLVYKECIGILQSQVNERYQQLVIWLDDVSKLNSSSSIGLSPHAPYSVHPQFFSQLMELARVQQLPVAMHLAESLAELDLLNHQQGEFRNFLEQLNLWNTESFSYNMTISDFITGLSQAPRASIIHGNYLTSQEIRLIKKSPNLTVVYCPRTHAYFKHLTHPWQTLMDHDVRVALGTDSKASNPDLNLWSEVQFLHQKLPHIHPQIFLQMATSNAAYALNLEHKLGSISPGLEAKFAVATSELEITDPWRCLLDMQTILKGWKTESIVI